MALDAVFERFVHHSPLPVMARLLMQRALSPEWLDGLFEQHRQRQYTRELLFSTEVDLMALVALGLRPSLHAAAQASDELKVSMQALYDKVHHTEPQVVRQLVQGCGDRLTPVLKQLKLQQPSWAAGYRVRVLDGNHLAASQKRLKPLRGFRGAALPGQSLVVYAPEWDLVVDMVPAEDAHAQERTLLEPVLERVQAGELWLADRNFSTTRTLCAIADKKAAFLIREHGRSPHPDEVGTMKKAGRVETGVVFEQAVEVEDEQGRRLRLRRIELQLDEPTEDGDSCIRLLTNVPAERMGAKEVAGLYRRRWSIEGMFGRLESVLKSEVSTLGYPRAALLAFGVAVMAYNVLAVLLAAVEAEHRLQSTELSSYYVAGEVKATYSGMMIAIPEKLWRGFESQTDEDLSRTLLRMASHVNPAKLRKHPRGQKKKVKKGYAPRQEVDRHVSTARVLRGDEKT
ncbi:IS4 family transposase [Myxococcus sp. RHSTA-1-4]|uniref:IS4 family transposase n=1 Tax=Myxococcus sp. RHSTA-1-4 TaxID=2874601 RepID=UPI001CBF37DC|nr:IS4 family transposase [Myxococcus sp. RHSTA-1-4]MBZ4423378.1 IS4 family transposase [Myxococcus sp. RHSTA-1-4]